MKFRSPAPTDGAGAPDPRAQAAAFQELISNDPRYVGLYDPNGGATFGLNPTLSAEKKAAGQDACCYTWTQQCPGGRPFLDAQSQPVVANFRQGAAWDGVALQLELELPEKVASEAARLWLADAAMEHASVASFGRVALELMALGAPPALVEATHRAALDEIRHAKICLSIARACGAAALEPGRMQVDGPRDANFGRLAADAFIEGCVGESTAALVLERAAAACGSAALAQTLRAMGNDETAHAGLAWRTVKWALGQGGAPAATRLREVASGFEAELDTREARGTQLSSSALAAAGRLSETELYRARQDAWFGVVKPMLGALLDQAGDRAGDQAGDRA